MVIFVNWSGPKNMIATQGTQKKTKQTSDAEELINCNALSM